MHGEVISMSRSTRYLFDSAGRILSLLASMPIKIIAKITKTLVKIVNINPPVRYMEV